jgi:PAS domain S-box-containing protein
MLPAFALVDAAMLAAVPRYRPPWLGCGLLVATFLLNRFWSHRVAARLTCWMFPLVVFTEIATGVRTGTSSVLPLIYLLVGTQFAALLLGSREAIGFALACLAGAACLPLVIPAEATGWERAWLTVMTVNVLGAILAIAFRRLRDGAERDRASELQTREEHYRSLVESNSDWLWEVDLEGRYTYVSPQVQTILVYSPGDMIGRRCTDFMPADEAEQMAALFQRVAAAAAPIVRLRNRNITRDGRIVVLETSGTPIFDETGALKGYRGIDRDVTEREESTRDRDRLRSELERNVNLLEHVLNGIPDIIGVQDAHHGIIRYNEAGYRTLGMSRDQVEGAHCFNLLGRPTPCGECPTAEAVQTGRNARIEKFVPELGLWFDARAYPVKDASGNVTYVIEHLRDITDQKQMEEQMRMESAFRHAVVQNAAEGICACHAVPDYPFVNFTVWNDHMTELTGYTQDEINRLGWYQSVYPDPETRERASSRMKAMRQGEHLQSEEWTITCKDGSARTLSISSSAFTLGDGTPQVLAVMQDITQRVQSEKALRDQEQRLRQAEKMEAIGQLAGGIAHDFNNQLAGILGYAEMLQQSIRDRKDLRLYVSRILSSAERSARLTRQLLSFARKGPMEMEPIELRSVISDVISILHRSIDKRIEVAESFDSTPCRTRGDASQLENALLNIGINARDAMPEGGRIEFSTRVVDVAPGELLGQPPAAPGRYVRISVRDTGAGMDEATRSHLFEPFFTTKPRGKGTGLGLPAVYGIVQAHKGFITVESSLGRGTTFSIHLPATSEPGNSTQGSVATSRRQDAIRVMLIDDEPVVVEVTSILLNTAGHRVTAWTDPEEAVEAYISNWQEVDLVLLDMVMPKLSGREVFAKIRTINPKARILLCSGYSVEGEAEQLLLQGAVGFLQKPFTREALLHKVQEAVAANG